MKTTLLTLFSVILFIGCEKPEPPCECYGKYIFPHVPDPYGNAIVYTYEKVDCETGQKFIDGHLYGHVSFIGCATQEDIDTLPNFTEPPVPFWE